MKGMKNSYFICYFLNLILSVFYFIFEISQNMVFLKKNMDIMFMIFLDLFFTCFESQFPFAFEFKIKSVILKM